MDEVLKPCPFCGGEAVSREYDERNPYEPFGLIIAHAEDCFLALHSSYDEYETRWNTRADAAPTPKADEVEAVARAIESASCPGREGPFGGYDYGHNEAFYGPAPEGGRYVIRDFRDPSSPDWGAWLHQTNDRDEHESMFARMTDDHVAQAAIAALDAARGDPVARVVEWLRNGGGTDISQLSGSTQMLFLKGMNRYADAIERGEPFNG